LSIELIGFREAVRYSKDALDHEPSIACHDESLESTAERSMREACETQRGR
jgi:hypothetical protein